MNLKKKILKFFFEGKKHKNEFFFEGKKHKNEFITLKIIHEE